MTPTDDLTIARDALARADWQLAYDSAARAPDDDAQDAAAREVLLADACWWLGRLDECIHHRETAYHAYEQIGCGRASGQCAVWLYEHYMFKARPAIASGWLQRARRALQGDTECVEYGSLMLREAELAHGRGELAASATAASDVIELARRLGSSDLEAEALQTYARVLIDDGRVADGLARFDEAMLLAIEGQLRPYTTGKVYCSLIGACEALGDLARAAEWTDATSEWARSHPFAVFPGICRVHRASALGWRGQLALAQLEAEKACAELVTVHVPNAAAAYAELGDIRRRLGDLAGSEEAFGRAEQLCGSTCAGLALLRLAQGRIDAATRIIDDCLHDTQTDRLGRARILPAHVQISIAAGNDPVARRSADELAAIAAVYDMPVLRASALTTQARVALAERQWRSAVTLLRQAVLLWESLDVPYESASARTLLGQALHECGDAEGADSAFRAAETIFEQIGARVDARRIRESQAAAPTPGGLTARELDVLRLVAAGLGNKAIAEELFLSEKTVSRHVSNIFAKIGVSSRASATVFAFQEGLVERRR